MEYLFHFAQQRRARGRSLIRRVFGELVQDFAAEANAISRAARRLFRLGGRASNGANNSVLESIAVTPENADSPENSPLEQREAELTNSEAAEPRADRHGVRQTADWDVRNAPKNYISLVAAHGATAFFSFASVWLVTRHLGSEGYGGIVAFVAASQLVQIFLNWSSTALARFGIEEFVETGRITRSFWSRTLMFFPNLLVVLGLSIFWLQPVAGWLKIPSAAVWLIAVHLAVTAFWLHVQYGLQGVKMLRLQGVLLAVERFMTFCGLLIAISLGHLTLLNALWCYIIPAAILSAAGLLILRPFIEMHGIFDRQHFRRMLMFSLPLIPFAVVGYLSTSQLDAFFITRYLSTRDLGIYAVAAQINGLLLQLPILANTVLLSMFVSLRTSGQEAKVSTFLNNVAPTAALIWGLICVGVAIVAGLLIPPVFGQDFRGSVEPLLILVLATAATSLSMFGFAVYSHSISATYISTVASVLAAITNLVFDLLLIPRWGLIGCAVATFLAQAILAASVVWLCSRKTTVDIRKVSVAFLAPATGVAAFLLSDSVLIASAGFLGATALAAVVISDAIKVSAKFALLRSTSR